LRTAKYTNIVFIIFAVDGVDSWDPRHANSGKHNVLSIFRSGGANNIPAQTSGDFPERSGERSRSGGQLNTETKIEIRRSVFRIDNPSPDLSYFCSPPVQFVKRLRKSIRDRPPQAFSA
jgi:hypothetical protein